MSEDEITLIGSNMTPVVRVGDTVRRRAGPWTPTVQAFMRHLRADGFSIVPQPLASTTTAARSSRCKT